jgi:hypothetical protein
LVTALVGVAGPGLAHATLPVTSLTAAPDSLQAAGHANFNLSMAFGGTEHAKGLVIHLPAGLIGNPGAATPCPEATFQARGCVSSGANSAKVGTSSIAATATTLGIPTDITASGDVYVLVPKTGEIARLGIDLYPEGAAATLSPHAILNESVVSVRTATDNGLDSALEGLPKTSQTTLGEADVHLKSLNLTLNAASGKGPFISNPSSCQPAVTTVDVTSYDSPGINSKSATYTPTGCDKVPFSPKVTLKATGDLTQGGRPALTAAVTQPVGQGAAKRVQLALPAVIQNELLHTDRVVCRLADQAKQSCPASSQIGTAVAETAVLPFPLTGPVYLAASNAGLPGLSITLAPLGITVVGDPSLDSKGRLLNTFDNLPDTPLTNFELKLNGGTAGILASAGDLCTTKGLVAEGIFTGHNGATTTATAPLVPVGCTAATPGKPTATAAFRRFGSAKRGSLTVTAKAKTGAAKLRRLKVTLPKGVSLRSVRKALIKGSTSGAKVKKSGSRGIIVSTKSAKGSKTLTVVLRRGALEMSKKSKRAMKVTAYDAKGTATSIKVTAKKK